MSLSTIVRQVVVPPATSVAERAAKPLIGLAARLLMPVVRQVVRTAILEEAGHFLTDIEWRYKQARELLDVATATPQQANVDMPYGAQPIGRQVTAEDLNLNRHVLTGYTVTNNSPVAGSIAWVALHVVYKGVDNTIADGTTALRFAWFANATPTVMQSSNTKPTLGVDDILLFVNNAGTASVAATDGSASLPLVLGNNSVDSGAIVANAVGTTALASGAVTNAILANGAVATANIQANAVTNATLAANAVATTNIQANAVTTGLIAANAITTGLIAANAVNTGQLAAGAVTSTVIGTGAVLAGNIGANAVGTTALASGAVTTAILGANAVTGANVALGTLAATRFNTIQHLLY